MVIILKYFINVYYNYYERNIYYILIIKKKIYEIFFKDEYLEIDFYVFFNFINLWLKFIVLLYNVYFEL